MTETTDTQLPPILDAYAALRCARRTHNDFDETVPAALGQHEFSPEVQARFDAGIEFDALIRRQISAALGDHCMDVTELGLFRDAATTQTVTAMNQGVPVILGGRLPDDDVGGRRGKPDVLVRAAERSDGRLAYVPVDIKRHKTLASAKDSSPPALTSPAYAPFREHATPLIEFTARKHERDAIQLAHYWRMLEACQRAPDGSPFGGIIGTDELGDGFLVVWHDLTEPLFRTFSRSADSGYVLRSAMQRYDHEFAFRSQVATVARERTGRPTDPTPLVEPIYIKECDDCPWFDNCIDQLGESDASAGVGRLSQREWIALRNLGLTDIDHLAALDTDVIDGGAGTSDAASERTLQLMADYLPEVSHLPNARKRLRGAVMAAQMVQEGTYLRRTTTGPVPIERADIEIDFDIEYDRDGRVYLWGMLVTDRTANSSTFEHVSTWGDIDDTREAALAVQFWHRLTDIVARAHTAGQSVKVYHYANPEPNHLRRIAEASADHDLPTLDAVNALIDDTFIDMFPIVRANFFGRDGLGLKVAATRGAGFSWRDEDPGGLQSITWLEQVRAGVDDLRQRVLEYNEDDVRATQALREWLAQQ